MPQAAEPLTLSGFGSPLGLLLVVTDRAGHVVAIDFQDHETRMRDLLRRQHRPGLELADGDLPAPVAAALEAYFDGDTGRIDDLSVAPGGTDFQRTYWGLLRQVRSGNTTTYGHQAVALGQPKAARAVGAANGANPIAIVVPCHRVIGADGSLIRYGGGLWRKRWLLDHEERHTT